jgi:hypothetical protein
MTTKAGRPPEISNRVKLQVYLSAGELRAIKRVAKQADVSASAWVRSAALATLRDRAGRTT